jgi:hypothetical protein
MHISGRERNQEISVGPPAAGSTGGGLSETSRIVTSELS